MEDEEPEIPIPRRLMTPGAKVCLAVALVGAICGIYRFALGLQASTNLSQQYPWGIWIIADVSFIALAASGFVTAAVAHVLHRHTYHSLVRPALIFALLGYTFACILLAADLGRYYNIWHPLLPGMWQGNSALFEVGMCVMAYLTVLYLEAVPVLMGGLLNVSRPGKLRRIAAAIHGASGKAMFVLVILGVTISCLHQSSLGHVMVLARGKLNPLWWTPILALLFVMSAIVAALPTAIFISICGAWSLGIRVPIRVVSRAARFVPLLLFVYFAFKLGDMVIRRSFVQLTAINLQSVSFVVEVVVGVAIPMLTLMSHRVRESARWLAGTCALVMFGIMLNRANVYWIGYRPTNATTFYLPSLFEIGFTVGAAAGLMFLWRALAIALPVIDASWVTQVPVPRTARRKAVPGDGEPEDQRTGPRKRSIPKASNTERTEPALV